MGGIFLRSSDSRMITRPMSSRIRFFRHAAIAAATVLVIAIAIAFLAHHWIQRDTLAFIDQSKEILSGKIQAAFLNLRAQEGSALEAIPRLLEKPPAEPDAALSRLAEEFPLVEEPFLAVHQALLWPRRSGSGGSWPQFLIRGSAATPLERELLARVLELQRTGKPAEALETIENMLRRSLEPATRTETILMRANLLSSDPARREEAIGSLEDLLENGRRDSSAWRDLKPWLLAALFRKGVLIGEAGRQEDSAMAFMELLENMTQGDLQEAAQPYGEFYLERSIEELAALESANNLSAIRREAVRERLRAAERIRQRCRFAESLENYWLAEISKSAPPNVIEPRHQYRRTEKGPELLVVASEKGDPDRLTGFLVNLKAFCDRLLEGMPGFEKSRGELFRIADASGLPVLDPASGVTDKHREVLEIPFTDDLPWKLQADITGQLRDHLQGRKILYGGLALASIAIVLIAAASIVRGLHREAQLAELKSQFVANVSHELKTPLTIIRMFADLLLLGYSRNPLEVESHLKIIARETENLDLLIDNVLDISRIESGEKEYHPAPENPVELVESALKSYRPYLERKGFAVRTDPAPGLPDIRADRLAFSQALRNLLSNAVKYSEAVREVEVRLKRIERGVQLEVADRGIGIFPSEAERIFQRFYRSPRRTLKNTGGAGIGLAIVKHIAEGHGGRAWAAPREGGGSSFFIIWPEAQSEPSDFTSHENRR